MAVTDSDLRSVFILFFKKGTVPAMATTYVDPMGGVGGGNAAMDQLAAFGLDPAQLTGLDDAGCSYLASWLSSKGMATDDPLMASETAKVRRFSERFSDAEYRKMNSSKKQFVQTFCEQRRRDRSFTAKDYCGV